MRPGPCQRLGLGEAGGGREGRVLGDALPHTVGSRVEAGRRACSWAVGETHSPAPAGQPETPLWGLLPGQVPGHLLWVPLPSLHVGGRSGCVPCMAPTLVWDGPSQLRGGSGGRDSGLSQEGARGRAGVGCSRDEEGDRREASGSAVTGHCPVSGVTLETMHVPPTKALGICTTFDLSPCPDLSDVWGPGAARAGVWSPGAGPGGTPRCGAVSGLEPAPGLLGPQTPCPAPRPGEGLGEAARHRGGGGGTAKCRRVLGHGRLGARVSGPFCLSKVMR